MRSSVTPSMSLIFKQRFLCFTMDFNDFEYRRSFKALTSASFIQGSFNFHVLSLGTNFFSVFLLTIADQKTVLGDTFFIWNNLNVFN